MPHFSALTWRILAFNTLALLMLTGGVIGVQSSGRGLVEERLTGIQQQAAIVAGTLARIRHQSQDPGAGCGFGRSRCCAS